MNIKSIVFSICAVSSSISITALAQQVGVPGVDSRITSPNGLHNFSSNMSITSSETFGKDFDQYSMRPILNHGRMFAYGTEYNIKGSRLLFEDWVRGTITKNSGEKIEGDKYYFNFDKITNNLIVTYDKQDIIEVYKDSIQSFTFNQNGQIYEFEKVASINKYRFVQLLVKNNDRYTLYKSVNTRFVAADYNTNGLTESGHPYDEYVDNTTYYIMYRNELRAVQLKFSSIRKALKENLSRVKDFYADHLDDEVNENYLISIVKYVN